MLCNMFNWFTFYCITRTLTNSLETILGVIGVHLLYHRWRLHTVHSAGVLTCTVRYYTSGIIVAALSCLIRPTGVILWIPVLIFHLYWLNDKLTYIKKLVAVGYVPVLSCVTVFSYKPQVLYIMLVTIYWQDFLWKGSVVT